MSGDDNPLIKGRSRSLLGSGSIPDGRTTQT